jgi:hypothetical protein
MAFPLIVQRVTRNTVSCGGIDTLLNENAAWIRIMTSISSFDELEPATSQSNPTLALIPAKASLQHLPHSKRGKGGSIFNNEMELSAFMRSAGLLTSKTSTGETVGSCDTPRAAGSNVVSKRMVESSPTNVTEYMELPFMYRLNDTEIQTPSSFEGTAGTSSRASKRKDADIQVKTRAKNFETNQISKKRQRDSKTDPLSSPARTCQRSRGDFIFSPNRQQAASNLVDLRNGSSGPK